MRFADALEICRGLTALIGGGGKTGLMYRLAEELRENGSVLVCTSTHIRRPEHLPVLTAADASAIRAALRRTPVVCVGTPADGEKLAAPRLEFAALTELADYVLVEADGSKMLPLKAHLAHEPVIPPNASQTIWVVGADGFGRPISEVCHRSARFAALAEAEPDEPVTPERLARVIAAEGYGDKLFINKVETPQAQAFAQKLAQLLPLPAFAGSLRNGVIHPCEAHA